MTTAATPSTDRTEHVSFRVTPEAFELLQKAADRAEKTVSAFCRDTIFACLDTPEAAHHAEVMAEFATIREQLQTLISAQPAAPRNPYAGLKLADVERQLERQGYLESNFNTIKFPELNELIDLRETLIGRLYPIWKRLGMPGVIRQIESGEVPPEPPRKAPSGA